jgi:hypothetical protein
VRVELRTLDSLYESLDGFFPYRAPPQVVSVLPVALLQSGGALVVRLVGALDSHSLFCRFTDAVNGNVLSVLIASAFLPFLPMLPLQLLVQNLLYDIAQTGIPFDRVDPEQVARPLHWQPADIGRFMLFFGPISSLFDLATFALMWWVFGANSLASQGLISSGASTIPTTMWAATERLHAPDRPKARFRPRASTATTAGSTFQWYSSAESAPTTSTKGSAWKNRMKEAPGRSS